MSQEKINESKAIGFMRCPLYNYGCLIPYLQCQFDQHCTSKQHVQSMQSYIESQEKVYDEASIELSVSPLGKDESTTQAAIRVDQSRKSLRKLTDCIIESILSSNMTNSLQTTSVNINQIYSRGTSAAQELITQQDRTTDNATMLQLNNAEYELNMNAMRTIINQNTFSSTSIVEDNDTEQNQNASVFVNIHQNLSELCRIMESIHEIDSESRPVSTDGCLIWHIDGIISKILNSPNKNSYDSLPFETSMGGYRVWARFIPRNSIDSQFISVRVHLNFPVKNPFQGTIKYALVDQSKHPPWQHHIKTCSGTIIDVNGYLGVDNFIEQNIIHQADSKYVHEDSIYLIIKIEQTTEEKYMNQPENIQDALMLL